MPIKETDNEIIFVETLKKSTLKDLLHFDDENDGFFQSFGIKNSKSHIADSLTKIISKSINANLLNYIEELVNKKNNTLPHNNGDKKNVKDSKNKQKVKNS